MSRYLCWRCDFTLHVEWNVMPPPETHHEDVTLPTNRITPTVCVLRHCRPPLGETFLPVLGQFGSLGDYSSASVNFCWSFQTFDLLLAPPTLLPTVHTPTAEYSNRFGSLFQPILMMRCTKRNHLSPTTGSTVDST
jgi:hypothetical protein